MMYEKRIQTTLLLSAMMLLVPALGAPYEELLQDTLKSILVSFFALSASLAFFWNLRKQKTSVSFHAILILPVLLMLYALGSMAWSHAYLGGVETIRWFIFSLILFLGMNAIGRAEITSIAWGIHVGAVIAALWAALQFWLDVPWFAQGPNPASTFVNRNFLGEFLVCTIPFSILLLTRVRDKVSVFFLTFSLGFNVVALMMSGTRSALVGFMLLLLLLPFVVYFYRKQIVSTGWRWSSGIALLVVFVTAVACLGSIPTTNLRLLKELGPVNALDRAQSRTLSIAQASEYKVGSFSIRTVMWKATGRMISAHPIMGVGAGAWEVNIPKFQESGSPVEPDYYAHNEILQLVAEYGVVGCLFLLLLAAYLLWAAYYTVTNRSEDGQQEGPIRTCALASVFALLLVSNAGFPWRMATTGALFALSLSILAASDMRLALGKPRLFQFIAWKPKFSWWALTASCLCSILAIFLAQQAIACESKIVRAIKIALTISQSRQHNHPKWDGVKTEMLQLINEGVVINPHYRKLTPMVADELARWGDWKNAAWIWESILESRPHVVALLANLTRAHMQMGDFSKAEEYRQRAQAIQPTNPAFAVLEVMLLSKTGKESKAASRAKELLKNNVHDPDLLRTAYYLGMFTSDAELAIQALELRIQIWPNQAIDAWLKLGQIYETQEANNPAKALKSYKTAYEIAPPAHKNAVLKAIPQIYHSKIK